MVCLARETADTLAVETQRLSAIGIRMVVLESIGSIAVDRTGCIAASLG